MLAVKRPKDRFWLITVCICILSVALVTILIIALDSYVPTLLLVPVVSIIITTKMYDQEFCHAKGCDKYDWIGRLYKFTCREHDCVYERCDNFVLLPSSICPNHICQRETCTSPITTSGKTFCDRHACIRVSCRERSHPGLRVCLDHKCALCNEPGIRGRNHSDLGLGWLCNDHIPCSTVNCTNHRVPGLDVCEVCDELEIMSEPPPTYAKSRI